MSTSTIITIAAVFVAGLLSGVVIFWLMSRQRQVQQKADAASAAAQSASAPPVNAPEFQPRFILAPVILALICLIAAVGFYAFLPSPLAFRFTTGGVIRSYMNTTAFVIIMVVAQALCALIAWVIAAVVIKMGQSAFKSSAPQVKLEGYISLMTNMVLLPQLILAYLMFDAFIFGVWEKHLVSVAVFAVATILIGSAVIFYNFIRQISKARSAMNKQ